jgi:hypothetical protein
LRQPLEDVALGVGEQVRRVAEDVGIIGDSDRRVLARREARAGDDDVDGAERQPLVDVGLLAELRGRVDLDLVAAVGAPADLLGGPDRLGVERLGDLVDVRPAQLLLGEGGASEQRQGDACERADRERLAHWVPSRGFSM